MSEQRYRVPDGMLKAALSSGVFEGNDDAQVALEDALRWLMEQRPTRDQMDAIIRRAGLAPSEASDVIAFSIIDEFQRRMFLALEPEVPEDIKDLLWHGSADSRNRNDAEAHNDRILEAYRRGRESK